MTGSPSPKTGINLRGLLTSGVRDYPTAGRQHPAARTDTEHPSEEVSKVCATVYVRGNLSKTKLAQATGSTAARPGLHSRPSTKWNCAARRTRPLRNEVS